MEIEKHTFHFEIFVDKGNNEGTKSVGNCYKLKEALRIQKENEGSVVDFWQDDEPIFEFPINMVTYAGCFDYLRNFLVDCDKITTEEMERIIEDMML